MHFLFADLDEEALPNQLLNEKKMLLGRKVLSFLMGMVRIDKGSKTENAIVAAPVSLTDDPVENSNE